MPAPVSLRDYLAGQAIKGLTTQWLAWEPIDSMSDEDEALIRADGNYDLVQCKQMAESAYEIADAMLAERHKGKAERPVGENPDAD